MTKANTTANNTVSMYETNYTMPKNLDVLLTAKIAVDEKVVALNAALDDKKDMASVKSLEDDAKTALKELNKKIAEQWLSEIKELEKVDAVKEYLNTAGEIGAFKLKNPSDESVHYTVISTKRALSFPTFNKFVNAASSSVYNIMAGRFLHNISLNISSTSEGIGTKALTMRMDGETAKKAGSDFKGHSNKLLEKQLQVIVNAMLPEGMEIKMKLVDLRFIKIAVQKAMTGKSAGVDVAKEKALYSAIVSAMYIRMNDLEYKLTSSASVHKDPKAK